MQTLEVRRLDPRGPAYPGELITSGTCVFEQGAMVYAHSDLAPFIPPSTIISVCLYVAGRYAGFATLGPQGFLQEIDSASPWLTIETFAP